MQLFMSPSRLTNTTIQKNKTFMKNFVLSCMILFTLTACAEVVVNQGDKVQENRSLSGFERIEQLGSLDVKYQQADSFSVQVSAPERVIKYVKTWVEDNKLIVCMEGKNINIGLNDGSHVTVYVTSPDFLGIELKGSGGFECKKPLDTDRLDVRLKGSGDIDFQDIICDHVNVSLEGSGDIELKKVVAQQSDIELVGSGDMKIHQQKVRQTKVNLKGSGRVELDSKDGGLVDTRLAGSGDIRLTGDIASHTTYKVGSGEVETKHLNIKEK